MYSPSRQCGGGKSQGEASLERKGGSGSFILKICLEKEEGKKRNWDFIMP